MIDEKKLNEPIEDLSIYDNLNKDELKSKAIQEFNIDEEQLKEETEKDAIFSKDTVDSIANLEYFAEKLENNLKGKSLIRKGKNEEYYIQTGKALAGDSFIRQVVNIIKTFANKSMLLSGKDEKEFFMQFEDAWYTISDSLLERKHNLSVINVRSIMKEVKDTFWNLGDIVMKTDKNMDVYFGKLNNMNEDVERKFNSKLRDGF